MCVYIYIYIYIYMCVCVCVCVCVYTDKIYFVIHWPTRCTLTEQILKLKPSTEGDKMTNERLAF